MTLSTRQLLDLKNKVSKLNEDRIRAESMYEQSVARLKELGYDSVEDAEDALAEMKEQIIEAEAKLANDVDALFDKYPDLR